MHSWWGPAGQQVAPAWTRVHQWGWGAPGLAPFCAAFPLKRCRWTLRAPTLEKHPWTPRS